MSNQIFIFSLLIIVVYNIHKLLFLDQWNRDFYELADLSTQYRYIILAFVVLNLILSMATEYFTNK